MPTALTQLIFKISVGLLIILFAAPSRADNDALLEIASPNRNIFSGKDSLILIHSTLSQPNSSINWIVSKNNQIISQGTDNLRINKNLPPSILIHAPDIKEGVVTPVSLHLSLNTTQNQRAITTAEFFIFHQNAFSSLRNKLTEMKIGLFDVDQTTRQLFEQSDIPLENIHSVDGLADFNGRIVMIGQGLDLNQMPSIGSEIAALSKRNITVIVLAPKNGSIQIPGDSSPVIAQKVIMAQENIIRETDKTLDTTWSFSRPTITSRFNLIPEPNTLKISTVPGNDGWAWIQISFQEKTAPVIFCGFDFTGAWEESPSPRYFLLRLLEKIITPQ